MSLRIFHQFGWEKNRKNKTNQKKKKEKERKEKTKNRDAGKERRCVKEKIKKWKRGIIENLTISLSVSTQEIKRTTALIPIPRSYVCVYTLCVLRKRKEKRGEIARHIVKRRERETEERTDMQGNISPRSADAICSSVVKGRSVGSVCANSCELTAYIGPPFCCVLASQPLHRASVFVRLYPHPRFSLCIPASSSPLTQRLEKASLAIQTHAKKITQKTVSDGESMCVHVTFVYSQEFDYTRCF